MIDDTAAANATFLAVFFGITGVVLALGVTALLLWVGYLITRTAVKNGIILAHQELDRRTAVAADSRDDDAKAPRLRDPDWRSDR